MKKLVEKIDSFRQWKTGKRFSKGRLVQYCGRERLSPFDFAVEDAEREIEGLLAEGFYVDWSEFQTCLYLKVWEFGGAEPSWKQVYEEVKLL